MATFWTLEKVPILPTLAVIWTHHLIVFLLSVKTANLGSSMVTFGTYVLWFVIKGHLVVILCGMELDFGSSVKSNNFWFLVDGFSKFS